jgi:hypothetical protein
MADSIASWFFSIVFSMLSFISFSDVGLNLFSIFSPETTPSSCLEISSLSAYLTSKDTSLLVCYGLITGISLAIAGVSGDLSMKSIVPSSD